MRDLGLGESSDTEVWNYASRHGYVLVSKDEDFLHHAIRSAGGELLWVRIGNCRRDDLLQAFEEAWQALAERLSEGDRILELR